MASLRFIGIVAVLFLAVFFGGRWLLEVRPLHAGVWLPAYHRVDKQDEPHLKLEKTSASDNDPTRDRLRNEVLDYAKAPGDDPCNGILKMHYIKVVTDYVRAWISIAPCLGTHTCQWSLDENGSRGTSLRLAARSAGPRRHAEGPRQRCVRHRRLSAGHRHLGVPTRDRRLSQSACRSTIQEHDGRQPFACDLHRTSMIGTGLSVRLRQPRDRARVVLAKRRNGT